MCHAALVASIVIAARAASTTSDELVRSQAVGYLGRTPKIALGWAAEIDLILASQTPLSAEEAVCKRLRLVESSAWVVSTL